MHTKHAPHRTLRVATLRVSLGAGILALALAGLPVAAYADATAPDGLSVPAGQAAPEPAAAAREDASGSDEAVAAEAEKVPVPDGAEAADGETALGAEGGAGEAVSGSAGAAAGAAEPDVLPSDVAAQATSAGVSTASDGAGEAAGSTTVEAPSAAAHDSQLREERAPAVVPVVTSGPLPAGMVGAAYTYQLTSNVSPVTFVVSGLPAGLLADAGSGLISGTPTADGEFTVRLEALGTEPGDTTQVRYDTLVIEPAPVVVPVITSGPMPVGTVGVPYSFQVTSNVAGSTFAITGLPSGLSADALTGLISGTPTAEGSSTVRLQAIGAGPAGDTSQVVYSALVIEPAPVVVPVITSGPLPVGAVGVPYSFQVTSNVAGSTFAITGLPSGLSADALTGLISGTPTAEGSSTVRLQAIGAGPAGDTSLVVYSTLLIEPAPLVAPVITSGPLPVGTVGVPYSFQVTATGVGLEFSARGLALGLSIDRVSGLISGTPSREGVSAVTLQVDDAAGQTATQSRELRVDAAGTTRPVITSGPLPAGTVGVAYSFQVTASGEPTGFAAAGLPAGLAIDTRSGLISGVPRAAGTVMVTVTARAGGLESAPVTSALTIQNVITPPITPPVFTSTPPVSATVGAAFRYTPTVTSGTPVKFSLTGAVPGLGFDPATGALTGTPTATGSYALTITATNGATQPGTQAFTLVVAAASSSGSGSGSSPSAPGAGSQGSQPPASAGQGPSTATSGPAVAGGTGTGREATIRSGKRSNLAETGSPAGGLLLGGCAGVVLLLGGAALLIRRRRAARGF